MNLQPMRYKGYVWPHNPRVYAIEYRRSVAVRKVPQGRYIMQDMGQTYRVLRGEGEFAGDNAYAQFKKLASVFYGGGAGLLTHPVWQEARAYFVKLELNQEPRADYVSYSFEFWEDYEGYDTSAAERTAAADTQAAAVSSASGERYGYHTVKQGDTMWAIASSYGLALSELVALNPEIKNPNLIHVGDKVRVA